MKKAMKIVLAMAMVLLMSGGAMAQEAFNAQGSTLVSGLYHMYSDGNNWVSPYIILSNISDKDVNCKITVYDHDGLDVTHYGRVMTGGTIWTVVSTGTGNFEIPAYSTRVYYTYNSAPKKVIVGYAKIEWDSSDKRLNNALIGNAFSYRLSGTNSLRTVSEFHIPVNDGNPF